MAKTVVVGDMHCKQPIIFPFVDRVIAAVGASRVVLLGDYVDEWGADADDVVQAAQDTFSWVRERRRRGLSVTTLVGNHDWAYLAGDSRRYWCSGHVAAADEEAGFILSDLKPLIACEVAGALATHAGVLGAWADAHLEESDDVRDIAADLNAMGAVLDPSLYEAEASRGGTDRASGPLWADRQELVGDVDPTLFAQVVGHSPVRLGTVARRARAGAVAFCDTMSLRPSGRPVGGVEGGGALLVLDDAYAPGEGGWATWVPPTDVGLAPWPELVAKGHIR